MLLIWGSGFGWVCVLRCGGCCEGVLGKERTGTAVCSHYMRGRPGIVNVCRSVFKVFFKLGTPTRVFEPLEGRRVGHLPVVGSRGSEAGSFSPPTASPFWPPYCFREGEGDQVTAGWRNYLLPVSYEPVVGRGGGASLASAKSLVNGNGNFGGRVRSQPSASVCPVETWVFPHNLMDCLWRTVCFFFFLSILFLLYKTWLCLVW